MGIHTQNLRPKIYLTQKKVIKVMTFSEKTDHSNPFSRLEFLKFDDIRQFQLLAFVYDCQNRLAPAQFHDFFVPCAQIHSFNTRLAARSDLFLERKNTFQYGIRSIEFTGARLWNMLPTQLRESSLPSVFRTNLKKNTFCQTIHDVLMISVVSSPPVKSATSVLISLFAHFTSFVLSHFN